MGLLSHIQEVRRRRLDLQRQADTLEQEEKGLIESVIQTMVTGNLQEVREGDLVAVLNSTEEPNVTSWPDLLDWIGRNQAFDIFQKRVTPSAVKARWKDGVHVNGIEPVTKRSIKFNI